MDTDMTDAGYDIDLDIGAPIEDAPAPAPAPQPIIEQTNTPKNPNDIPAAYFEDFNDKPQQPWPESLNLQGVNNFDPHDPLYYAMEHLGTEIRVKDTRWVKDSSLNLIFYSAEDAARALVLLTHPDVMNADQMSAQDSRPAKSYSKKPDSALRIREANAGDQKNKGAARQSNYYQRNPDVANNRQRDREPRRRQPQQPRGDFLDYGDDDVGSRERRQRNSGDDDMGDAGYDRQRNRRNDRDSRDPRGRAPRGGRLRDDRDSGRLRDDVDSYRPGSRSPRESRAGRLRGRSASPASGEEGDGRYGFAEDSSNLRTRYRSRSRSRTATRRRNEPASGERWTHDKYGTSSGRWQKDSYIESSPMGNHRRSDAMDEGRQGSDLLSRMTKNGVPLASQKRSLADRITRSDDDGDSFGRLKGDDSAPRFNDFEQRPKRSLIDRMSRETDEINIRGRGQSQEGINIRGQGGAGNGTAEGINIRGVASGA